MIESLLTAARAASLRLLGLGPAQTDALLRDLAAALEAASADVVAANGADLAAVPADYPLRDRLLLDEGRLRAVAADVRAVAALPSPLGRTLAETVRPNGMTIRKVSVPFGVIGVIYEARPNVTVDVFTLCLKAGSACVLKGGKEAARTNAALVAVVRGVLRRHGLPEAVCTLLPAGREATAEMLEAVGQIDLVIPRGSARLIDFVRRTARVPVIETGAGVCHTYFDASGDLAKGAAIVLNGKTRRVSVCNALDCLLLHRSRIADLPALLAPIVAQGEARPERAVTLLADGTAYEALTATAGYPAALLRRATEADFGREMLDYVLALRVVDSLDEALLHIARYSSRHSEAIVAEDPAAQLAFQRMVDAACVYVNLPTSWTDGAQFGFGAEIGISTQKLHARGPMALPEITTYKYLIVGDGQVRP